MGTNFASALLLAVLLAPATSASTASEPEGGILIVMECSATGNAAPGCAGASVVLEELAKKHGFGPNSEIMKSIATVKIVGVTFDGPRRETNYLNKVSQQSGVSITDIETHGLLGGSMPVIRKLTDLIDR